MRYFIFRPTYDSVEQFNFDKDLASSEPFSQDQDAVNPDLSAFQAHGGKLILYHGWADHSITPGAHHRVLRFGDRYDGKNARRSCRRKR